MKNRYWISKMCIYDFLSHINEEEDVVHCVVTRITGKVNSLRCKKYNQCTRTYSLGECGYMTCGSHCKSFHPDCDKCLRDFLNEEREVKPKW